MDDQNDDQNDELGENTVDGNSRYQSRNEGASGEHVEEPQAAQEVMHVLRHTHLSFCRHDICNNFSKCISERLPHPK